jgi:hypothetical protein
MAGSNEHQHPPGCKLKLCHAPAGGCLFTVAALERSDNVANPGHAFAGLKRGYPRRTIVVHKTALHLPLRGCLLQVLCLLAAQLTPA